MPTSNTDKCIRCDLQEIDNMFEIKHGLHDWKLCKNCSIEFYEWVIRKQADKGCLWGRKYFLNKYGLSQYEEKVIE